MVAYTFYWIDEIDRIYFIALLPERRKKPERITRESILNWAKMVLSDNSGPKFNSVYFIQVDE